MVNLDVPLKLEARTVKGKGLNKLRHNGFVPAVIHNHGQDSILVMAPTLELEKVYAAAGGHHPLNLEVGDQKFLALIKDVHVNPVKRHMEHVIFQAIRRDEKVEAEVPLHFEGDPPAEKVGLMVLHQLDHVEVEALPANLPDQIIVDATKLAELHDKITVGDLAVPADVTILTEADHPIAQVVETPAQVSEEAEAAEGEEGAETAEGEAAGGEGDKGQAPEAAEKSAAGHETPKE